MPTGRRYQIRSPLPRLHLAYGAEFESRRSPVRLLRRMAEALVTVAALVTLLIGTLLIPRLQRAPVYSASYIDVLSAEHSNLDYAEVVRPEILNEGRMQ